jgi:hypothetical protein
MIKFIREEMPGNSPDKKVIKLKGYMTFENCSSLQAYKNAVVPLTIITDGEISELFKNNLTTKI